MSEWMEWVSECVSQWVSEWVSEWVSGLVGLTSQQTFTGSKSTIETLEKRKISSKLTIKIPESRRWRHSDVFIFNFEHILHLLLEFIVDFDQVYASWVHYYIQKKTMTYILEN